MSTFAGGWTEGVTSLGVPVLVDVCRQHISAADAVADGDGDDDTVH